MTPRLGSLALLVVALHAPLAAQTIQLPSIHQFSVDTTVIAPDSGQAWVAGEKRAASGSNQFNGVPSRRSVGLERQAAGAAVTARIHDPQEADDALLRQARQRPRAGSAPAAAAGPKDNLVLSPGDPGLMSVAEIKRQRAAQAAAQDSQARALVKQARQARDAGDASAASRYYRLASGQATGALQREIDAELRRFKSARAASSSQRTARAAK